MTRPECWALRPMTRARRAWLRPRVPGQAPLAGPVACPGSAMPARAMPARAMAVSPVLAVAGAGWPMRGRTRQPGRRAGRGRTPTSRIPVNPTILAQQDRRAGRITTANPSLGVISVLPSAGRPKAGPRWGTGPIPISTPASSGTARRDRARLRPGAPQPGRGRTRTLTPVSPPLSAGQAARSLAVPAATR